MPHRLLRPAAFAFALALLAAHPAAAAPYKAVSLSGFSDSIHHWQLKRGSDYPRFAPEQIVEIADNILLYQRDNGGWVENQDPARILDQAEKDALIAAKSDPRASFDNRNVYNQIAYLMAVFDQTHDEKYRVSALKGFDFLLSRQMSTCGGWPHTVPPVQSYHDKLTIADEVMSGPLTLLRQMARGKAPFTTLEAPIRARAAEALKKGDECVLKLQVRQNGLLTGWAGQYDPVTLVPSQGRTFELPAIVSQETVEMVRYLLSLDEPSDAQVAAIEGAIAWFKRSEIKGFRLVTIPLEKPVEYQYHTATFDRALEADPKATGLWARFYDLSDNSVVLANRDGVRVQRFDQIHPERRSGYSWYGDWPKKLLEVEYPAWKVRHKR